LDKVFHHCGVPGSLPVPRNIAGTTSQNDC
jgi:hypothetical protein